MIANASGVADHSISGSSEYSPAGVRYFDGQINVASSDLSTGGFGNAWNQTRSWSNGSPPSSFNGTGVLDTDRPLLLNPNGDNSQIIVVSSATNARFFNLVNGSYVPQFFVQDQLTHNTGTGEFVLTDTVGDTLHFWDWTASLANERGQFKSCTDPMGNTISVTSYTTNGTVAQMQRTDGTTTQAYVYTYLASPDPNAGEISNITLEQKLGSGSWTIVRQVSYTYYNGTQSYGNLGDLLSATTLDANNHVIDTAYNRYYTPSDAGGIGYVHGLKYVFSPQSYARMTADISNPQAATDAQVAPYADDSYQYIPSTQQVSQAVIQGSGCSVCTGGQGTFTYAYATSSNPQTYNSWATRTVETLPDGSTNTVYANFAGETMLNVFQSGSQKWENFYEYDGSGRQVLQANPSAVTGYNDSYADLLDKNQVGDYGYLSSSSGLLQVTDYYATTTATPTTAGGVAGYFQDSKLEQGKSGTPVLQQSVKYIAHTAGATVYPVAVSTVYRNTNGTGAETTSDSYTWFSGTNQIQTKTVSLPVISSAENGPGSADLWVYSYDSFERLTQTTDPDGDLNTYQYDQATGAQTQSVIDSGSNRLNLTTTTVVDVLGRPVKVTDPNGNITYTVYNDANHEVRVYPGWTGTATTGPTLVSREDRSHDPSYTETFTMSATPHVTNGQPDGSEAYAFLQSLARTIASKGGQVQETDDYFNLGGVPYSSSTYLGTAGTNYYATLSTYDDPRGWLDRVQAPTGTISRTVFDVLGRVLSTWVGTNDTPASGSWSPTNNTSPSNMVQVTGNVWDGGGIGDSTLTQVTLYPGGSAPARVTQNYFDWRDRLAASKQGVQASENDGTGRPIFYSVYDNLGEITSSQRYDGDGVSITYTGGVPNAPSISLLQAQTTTEYDDQGRVYQSNVYAVSQGTISTNSLTTNTWYNHRGLVVQVTPPDAASTKTAYDGAGRPTAVYTADAIQDTTWNYAMMLIDDVLTQTETTYDNDGNALLVTQRDHFDNDSVYGSLGNPTTEPYARVYYVANYYDAANRLTASVNVGTNGGAAYTRPGTVPARSDTVLVTSTGYLADAVQQVMLTGSPTGGTFRLIFGGQTTAAIAYNATASTVQSALQNLSSIGANNALVSGPAGGPWQVRFAGSLAGTPEAEMTASAGGLTGGNHPSVAIGTISQGGDTGRVQSTTDPRALISKTDYDLLGRTLRTIQNFVSFAPSNSADQTTQYTYDGSNHILTLSAVLPGYVLETTQYTYGVTGSIINSKDLLASVTYPGESATDSYTYDALGETLTHTDRNGTTHTYSYDILGRQTADAVTTLGSGVDGSVRLLKTAYDTAGHPYLYTSYADTGGTTVVNQVEQVYDGLNDVLVEYQSHAGAVNLSTTPKVQYQYSFVASSGSPNSNRLTEVMDPNGNYVTYNYNAGVDNDISRVSWILLPVYYMTETYTYLGLSTVVSRTRQLSSGNLTQSYAIYGGSPDGGDQYTGLDRCGRILQLEWLNTATNQTTDNTTYTYDRDGNVLTRSQEFFATEQYGYDGLNQSTSYSRGSHTQSWGLDAVGNWTSFTNDGTNQTRSFNNQNQLTAISGATTPTYDNNGNTTKDETGKTYTMDAWNRTVKGVSGSNTEVYTYDGLGRRVTTKLNSNTVTDLYFSTSWQVLEEDQGGVMKFQNAWAPDYVDDLVQRLTPSANYYIQQDANWNVTSLADTTGTVQEYYTYDPYGKVSFYDHNLNPLSGSQFGMVYLFQGGRYDTTSGLYNFRNRDLSPTLGRWMQEDPIGYIGGYADLYAFLKNQPVNQSDPTGKNSLSIQFWTIVATGNVNRIIQFLDNLAKSGFIDQLQVSMATGATPLEGVLGAIFARFPAKAFRCFDSSAKVSQVFKLFGQNPKYLNVTDAGLATIWYLADGKTPFTDTGKHRAVIVAGRVYDALTGPKGMALRDYANMLKSLGIYPVFH
jgi:RHS repeat-associated protein